ncbi:MAG: hypothetical protein RBS68_08315 [Anaerolineales bacterium]|jgi:hypothetical protein|nr:hypothetical protein [Anaerolineales bacterium]
MKRLVTTNYIFIYVASLSILEVVLGFFTTFVYGPAISGDSMYYLSVADNLLSGRGMIDSFGGSLTNFPPLLPILLSTISRLFHIDVLFTAWVLNVVLMGINFILINIWLYRFFQHQKIYFFIASLFVLLSTSNLIMHTSVLSEPLYLTFILLFFIYSWKYVEKQAKTSFVILLLIATLSPLLRFSGFAQILTAALLIVIVYRKRFLLAVFLVGIFSVFSLSLIVIWLSLDNFLRYPIFLGDKNQVDFTQNFLQSLRKILYWFLPYRPFSSDGLLEPLIFLACMIILLLILNKKNHWANWLKSFTHPAVFSMMLFTIIYFISSTGNIITAHHRDLSSDRYYVVIMLPILVLLIGIFQFLIRPHIYLENKYLQIIVLAVFTVWSIYPLVKMEKFIDISRQGKPHYYNVYNIHAYQSSATLMQAKRLLQEKPDAVIYSNVPQLVWLHTRVLTNELPKINKNWSEADIIFNLSSWPGERPGYIVFFEKYPYKKYFSLDVLEKIANLELIYAMDDGAIFYVSPK